MIRNNPSSTTLVQTPTTTTPGSLPGMTNSRSSKSSSFQSLPSEDGSVLTDVAHFEDIGLDDETSTTPKANNHNHNHKSRAITRSPAPPPVGGRTLAANKRVPTPRRSFPNLQTTLYTSNPRSTSTAALGLLADPRPITLRKNYSTPSVPQTRRDRSVSPRGPLNPRDPHHPARPRRGSWQSVQQRKSISELEQECDEDEGDDIPDGLVLDNVPISPRPPHERPPSRAPSTSASPERAPKERVRSVGNGTPPVAQAQGSLRSPTWKAEGSSLRSENRSPSPLLKTRSHSWNAAHADLNAEVRALTEKLEEHADIADDTMSSRRPSATTRPYTWNSTQSAAAEYSYDKRERVKSSTPELPPLRRTHGMIDPLPVSKEKEAVLSRTRPSWLPPKDPAEEKKHLKQYQKMMAASLKADERREAARRTRTTNRDSAADHLMHIWENDIVPRWNEAIRERRTRDLWWKGVAPRSRAKVWTKAIGNELGLSGESFHAALSRAQELEQRIKENKADAEDARIFKWFEHIRRDTEENTWNELRIFQHDGPLHDALVDVLRAYAMYRVDIGYVSGCNTIAALLLLNLPDSETAFVSLANVLNRPLPLSFYTYDSTAQASAYNLVMQTLNHKSTALHDHLTKNVPDLDLALILNDLLTSLFTSLLAIDEAARLWDVYVFEGDALLVRATVAVLLEREMDLLGSKTVGEVWKVMAKVSTETAAPRAVGEVGAEDRFMLAVRNAGKA